MLNLLVTDGPTDDWQQVTVQIKSVSVFNHDENSWVDVWVPDPAKPEVGKVNLVDLSGVSLILQNAQVPVGTYRRLKLVIDTDPATMVLEDDLGNVIPPSQITVVDPSGRGEIKIELDPAITVVEGETASVEVDFDLTHPGGKAGGGGRGGMGRVNRMGVNVFGPCLCLGSLPATSR